MSWGDGKPKNPARELKVFSPKGQTLAYKGWVAIGTEKKNRPNNTNSCKVFMIHEDGREVIMNPRCVVWCEQDREIAYSPRNLPDLPPSYVIMTDELSEWLTKNPHWPALLELEGDDEEGLY